MRRCLYCRRKKGIKWILRLMILPQQQLLTVPHFGAAASHIWYERSMIHVSSIYKACTLGFFRGGLGLIMVFNTTFNNISIILWCFCCCPNYNDKLCIWFVCTSSRGVVPHHRKILYLISIPEGSNWRFYCTRYKKLIF
jgi:hypothetical protein